MTMTTFLPPISRWTFLNDGAARSATVRPTSVEPVNDTTRTSSLASMDSPTSLPPPVTRFTTPGGTPASSRILTKFTADNGRERRWLEDDGVSTDERRNDLPRWNRHREIPWRDDRGTPSGWRTDIANLSRSSDGTVWPYADGPRRP